MTIVGDEIYLVVITKYLFYKNKNKEGSKDAVEIISYWSDGSTMKNRVILSTASWFPIFMNILSDSFLDTGTKITFNEYNHFMKYPPAIMIQKTFRGFLGRRIATERRYRPGAIGFFKANEEFKKLV